MQIAQSWLKQNPELDALGLEVEKEDSIRKLLGYLNGIEGDAMEYVLANPRFQVAWKRACKVFGFYSEDSARCSASNIEAFRYMVAQKYPEAYQELSGGGVQAVESIKDYAAAESDRILQSSDAEVSWLQIGPIELLKKIWVNGFGVSTAQTRALYALLSIENTAGYSEAFSQYVMTHFVSEDAILKFLKHVEIYKWKDYRFGRLLSYKTQLKLISRLKSWEHIFGWDGIDYKVFLEAIVRSHPQEFLELIRARWNVQEMLGLMNNITSAILDARTQEDTVFSVARVALEGRRKDWVSKYENPEIMKWPKQRDTTSDAMHRALVIRFPERYVATLEEEIVSKSVPSDKRPRPWYPPEEVLQVNEILATLTAEQEIWGRQRENILTELITAGMWPKLTEMLFQLKISKEYEYILNGILLVLAKNHPKIFSQKILASETSLQPIAREMLSNPLKYHFMFAECIRWGAAEEVLAIHKNTDWNHIDMWIHALFWKYLPDTYPVIAKEKGFEYNKIAQEMVHRTVTNVQQATDGIIHDYFLCDIHMTYGDHLEQKARQEGKKRIRTRK